MINWIYFDIDVVFDEHDMMNKVCKTLKTWNGGKYKKAVITDKECFDKARNYWCREKAKPIGGKFIYPILVKLFQVKVPFNLYTF